MKSLGDSAQLYSAIAFILYLTIKRIKRGVATYVGESVDHQHLHLHLQQLSLPQNLKLQEKIQH